jgi:hypothetical protein
VREFSIRFVVATAVLLALGRLYGPVVVTPILPGIAWIIEAVDDHLRVDKIAVVDRPANSQIELKVTPIRVLVIGGQVMTPGPTLYFEPKILVGSVLQPVILFLAIVLAWPADGFRAMSARLLLAAPVCAVLIAVDTPLAIVGGMRDFRAYFPHVQFDALVCWNDFLQSGGPLGLAGAAGALVLSATERKPKSPTGT